MGLRIAVHANHRAIEAHLYNLFPNVEFLRFGPDGEMHLRDLPPNCKKMSQEAVMNSNPDLAIAREGVPAYAFYEREIPTIIYLSGPPQGMIQKRRRAPWLQRAQAIVAYSKEHKALWDHPTFPPIFVCRYPIDTDVFKGYYGTVDKALMIATMRMSWWQDIEGDWKGAWLLRLMLQRGVPFQLIGFGNKEEHWKPANPYPINSEAEMVEVLALHSVYAHTGSFLCRSPLEALAVGAPVVIRQTQYSHYFQELPHGKGVFRTKGPDEFQSAVEYFLRYNHVAAEHGIRGRQRIKEFFSPEVVRAQWQEVFDYVLSL